MRNYSTIKPGDPYSAATLDQYLRRLNGTGYFASAQAAIDADPAKADDATVKLALIEAPTKTFESGIGYSTDTEFRINASYRNVDINGRALQFYADARIETLVQSGSIRFVQPPGPDGWIDSLLLKWEHTNLNHLITQTSTAGVRRGSIDERNQWQYGAQFINDSLDPNGAEKSSSHALSTCSASGAASMTLSPPRGDGYSTVKQASAFPARRHAASRARSRGSGIGIRWAPIISSLRASRRAPYSAPRVRKFRRRFCFARVATRPCAAMHSTASA
ncbi:MAG: hypothetical protein E6H71_01880 [Betaproteobacteria bacterium]|nr:MAG: hypothetical protein E6H71_01880 [Betaproteobacteria bacterium]